MLDAHRVVLMRAACATRCSFSMGFAQAFVQLFGSATVFYILPRIAVTRMELALWITAGVW